MVGEEGPCKGRNRRCLLLRRRGFEARPRLHTYGSEPFVLRYRNANVHAGMKSGFDVYGFDNRMRIALQRMRVNRPVSLHNRLKILKFLDDQETEGVGIARRIKYAFILAKPTC